MTFNQTMDYLESLQGLGSKLGLETVRELCKRLNNPQDHLSVIHVAGTNGKGSVIAFMDSILRAGKYCVGKYISPTIRDYRERIQINERMISKRELCHYVDQIKVICNQMVEDGYSHPTSFEFETAMAFLYFCEKKVDIVLLETGMGGRLDATNVLENPLLSVITPISMDHMEFLGNSLEAIAREKAGIVKRGAAVLSAVQSEQVRGVLQSVAIANENDYIEVLPQNIKIMKQSVDKQIFIYKKYKKMTIQMAGTHQIYNAALAIEAIEAIQGRLLWNQTLIQIDHQVVQTGLEQAHWSGRLSILAKSPLIICDGAHNLEGAKVLANTIREQFEGRRKIWIMGVLKDKDYVGMLQEIEGITDELITLKPPGTSRALESYELAKEAMKMHRCVSCADSVEEAFELALLLADKESVIVAFGSLYYLGKLMDCNDKRINTRRK